MCIYFYSKFYYVFLYENCSNTGAIVSYLCNMFLCNRALRIEHLCKNLWFTIILRILIDESMSRHVGFGREENRLQIIYVPGDLSQRETKTMLREWMIASNGSDREFWYFTLQIDVWWGVWRCMHAQLAPLTPHPLARDRYYGPASGQRGDYITDMLGINREMVRDGKLKEIYRSVDISLSIYRYV